MASSIIHMAVTRLTALKLNLKDSDRLLLGAVLPDLCADEYPNSHLKLRIRGGTKNTYDLAAFRNSYGNLMAEDCLYLGYYLHLVQDISTSTSGRGTRSRRAFLSLRRTPASWVATKQGAAASRGTEDLLEAMRPHF